MGLKGIFDRFITTRTGKKASLTALVLAIGGKVLGYVRTLITAAFFGTGPAMDAFNVTTGIADIFVGTTRLSVEVALLPALARVGSEPLMGERAERSLMAAVLWFCLLLSAIYSVIFVAFPESLITMFAFGFEGERVSLSIQMLILLIPFMFASALYGMLATWALHREKLALPAFVESLYNLTAIPLLLFLVPVYGPLGLPLALSLGWTARFGIMAFSLRGIPWRIGEIPWKALASVGKGAVCCLGMVAATAIYHATDKFFASLLPVGTVAAIGYASFIFSVPLTLMEGPLQIFLAKSSRYALESQAKSAEVVEKFIGIAFYYFLPLGLWLAILAGPLIEFAMGYGAFTEEGVRLTGHCLSAYAVALPFTLAGAIIWRYSQAQGKLRSILLVTYASIVLNGFLDWLFSRHWGGPGIAFATSLVTLFTTTLNAEIFLPKGAASRILSLSGRLLFYPFVWGLPVFYLSKKHPLTALIVGSAGLLLNWLAVAKIHKFKELPEEWLPSHFLREIFKTL